MRNRIRHLLADWNPEIIAPVPEQPESREDPEARATDDYALPRGINMLMPVELCINRELLVSLLSASIREIQRHKRDMPEGMTTRELAEVEAALQQQLSFRSWVRRHPGCYVSIAMYPVIETLSELDDLDGEFPE
jgi:hypothetical protein